MIILDTSIWIEFLKQNPSYYEKVIDLLENQKILAVECIFAELLQGARSQKEWGLLEDYLATQYYLEASDNTWRDAARVYFELRRRGVTINSPVDCCIAQIALEHGALLLHRDKDFEKISRVRPLEQERFNLR